MSALSPLLDVLFPPRCAACRELLPPVEGASASLAFCVVCETTLEPLVLACDVCGFPDVEGWCAACLAESPPFDRVCAGFHYGAAIADVLHRYKYEDHPELAGPLGERLAALSLDAPDLVVPVPLHASRRRKRTYDQALYLAQRLAKLRGWRLDAGVLVRERATRRQVDQHREERVTNVAGAFRVAGDVRGKRVLLVDDVVTTGATVAECARVLKAAGAKRVEVAAVARAA